MGSRLSFKFIFPLMLAALSHAQGWREATLIIDLDNPARIRAWLSLPVPIPDPVAQAFAQTVGCPPAVPPAGANSVALECPATLHRERLRWSAHWDLTGLNAELRRAGAELLQVEINHPRSGFSRLTPSEIAPAGFSGFEVSYRGSVQLAGLPEITLEAGYRDEQIRPLAAVAAFILLLPLLLIPARAAGPLHALAAANGLFVLAATAWLCATLPLHAAGLAPWPWNIVIVSAPMLIAVGIGARLAGGPRWRPYFWRGALAVSVLTLIDGLLGAGPSLPWTIVCAAALFVCVWRLRYAPDRRLQPLPEGDLLTRIRQLALRAGTAIKSVRVITGGQDLPTAYATRFGGILLSGGLLQSLGRREVDAIVAHELSHVRNPQLVLAPRAVVLILPIAIVPSFFAPASLQWLPLLLPPIFLLHRAFRRHVERLADCDAVAWSRDGEALITALVRVTRAHGMPIEWPRWVEWLMPHPSTMHRIRAAAAEARIRADRFAQLLADSSNPPPDSYPIPGPPGPAGAIFTPAARMRLIRRLSLVALAAPVACGVAAPYIGYLPAFLLGVAADLCICECILERTRQRARALFPKHPGCFAAFRPSLEHRIYEGSYDYDWGFAAFEGASLVFRGDRCHWTVARADVERIWSAPGPANWLPRPVVCVQLKNGAAFCLRPFDRSFGPAAARATAHVLAQAREWRSTDQPENGAAAATEFDFSAVTGLLPTPFTLPMFLRTLPRYIVSTLLVNAAILAVAPAGGWPEWIDPLRLLGPSALACAVALFVAWPSLRNTRVSATPVRAGRQDGS